MKLFLLLFLGMAFVEPAKAYNCIYMGVDENKNLSGFVFEGTVKEIQPKAKSAKGLFETPNTKIQFVTFQVDKVWNDEFSYRMNENKEVEIFEPLQGGGGCPLGFGFEQDKKYLVFARSNEALLQAQAFGCTCSDSSEVSSAQAKKDLKEIKAIAKRQR